LGRLVDAMQKGADSLCQDWFCQSNAVWFERWYHNISREGTSNSFSSYIHLCLSAASHLHYFKRWPFEAK
jgi:hypothetical protein